MCVEAGAEPRVGELQRGDGEGDPDHALADDLRRR